MGQVCTPQFVFLNIGYRVISVICVIYNETGTS